MSKILVVGSLAYDAIKTPAGSRERTLGGSANYFSIAASLYAGVRVVGVVGEDYTDSDFQKLRRRDVDLKGIQVVPGKTFFWKGEYEGDLNEAKTLATELNVFEHFSPKIPADYSDTPYVFLANIDPVLQLEVLKQVKSPLLVGSDTMNFWIATKRPDLFEVLKRVGVLLINEGEAKMLTDRQNAVAAAKDILKMGPKAVVVKRGEFGFLFASTEGFFALPAFPVAEVVDPTGAGDTFAGAFFGSLAKSGEGFSISALQKACVHGALLASFTVQGFGVEAIDQLTWADVVKRSKEYEKVVAFGGFQLSN